MMTVPSDMKFRIAEFYSNNEMKMNTYEEFKYFINLMIKIYST